MNEVMACHGCGKTENLVSLFHRDEKGNITGSLFLCKDCLDEYAGKSLALHVVGSEKEPAPGNYRKIRGKKMDLPLGQESRYEVRCPKCGAYNILPSETPEIGDIYGQCFECGYEGDMPMTGCAEDS